MSSSNYRRNKAALDAFRKDLEAEMGDLSEIDIKLLNQAVNEGVRDIKKNTPVRTGHLRKSWRSAPAVKGPSGVKKVLVNMADYSEFVNYGHRVVSRSGKTTGFVPGNHMLEKGISYIDRQLMGLFKAEIERIRREHDG